MIFGEFTTIFPNVQLKKDNKILCAKLAAKIEFITALWFLRDLILL